MPPVIIDVPADPRREVRDSCPAARRLAASVAVIFDGVPPLRSSDGTWSLPTKPAPVSPPERFSEQREVVRAFTGVLVGPDVLLTTRHRVNVRNPQGLFAAFGFAIGADGIPKTRFASDEVFRVCEVLGEGRYLANPEDDWLLLRLDAKPARPALELDTRPLTSGTRLWMIGHPEGLPMKFVDGAHVIDTSERSVLTDLVASRGNSGSPVFREGSAAVLGILRTASLSLARAGAKVTWQRGKPGAPRIARVTRSQAFAARLQEVFAAAPAADVDAVAVAGLGDGAPMRGQLAWTAAAASRPAVQATPPPA
ncbi:MAG TPA: serine protease [Thermoanaerobaculia bacterium]|jgi:hypothetical protein|nr:serine protease [Thermoanaerobaculia bacterium]